MGRLIATARYFFRVYHEHAELDYEGEELPDRHEATIMAGQTLLSIDGKLKSNCEWRMEVMEFQNPLYVLHINAEKPK